MKACCKQELYSAATEIEREWTMAGAISNWMRLRADTLGTELAGTFDEETYTVVTEEQPVDPPA